MTLRELADAILALSEEQQQLLAVFLEPWDKDRLCLPVELTITKEDVLAEDTIIPAGHPILV